MYIGEIVFYLGAVLTVYSGLRYMVKNKHVLADATAAEPAKSAEAAPAAADSDADDDSANDGADAPMSEK